MIERELATLIRDAVEAARTAGDLGGADMPEVEVTRPRQREHGDWATNVALALPKIEGKPPREIADTIVRHLPEREWVRKVEIAGPGFINFHISNAWLHQTCSRVLQAGDRFGSSDDGSGESVNVEFVSINPTGPLHVGAGRNAAVGDAVVRLLEFTGRTVTREYYFNDAGTQMDLFGSSVAARYLEACGREVAFPPDGYHGEYVVDLAHQIRDEDGDRYADTPLDELGPLMRDRAYPIVIRWIEDVLERFRVSFDVWFKERDLYESGRVQEVIDRLRAAGHVYDAEGAVWLGAEALGDTRDRVLIKSSGAPTYLAGDLAYHLDKAERGFDRMIVVLGADHHGQVPSLVAGMQALGIDRERIEAIIYQFVHMVRGGEPVPLSKRTGAVLSLDELLDEVGTDAARYTLLQTSSDHDIRFDIEEVKKQSLENPVYYVQYAHARIASILRHAAEQGVTGSDDVIWDELVHESEIELMRPISEFEETVMVATNQRAPYRIAKYAEELARRFHRFYTDCRVVTDDERLTTARLALCQVSKQVLANALSLLGVSAPERMDREPEETT